MMHSNPLKQNNMKEEIKTFEMSLQNSVTKLQHNKQELSRLCSILALPGVTDRMERLRESPNFAKCNVLGAFPPVDPLWIYDDIRKLEASQHIIDGSKYSTGYLAAVYKPRSLGLTTTYYNDTDLSLWTIEEESKTFDDKVVDWNKGKRTGSKPCLMSDRTRHKNRAKRKKK